MSEPIYKIDEHERELQVLCQMHEELAMKKVRGEITKQEETRLKVVREMLDVLEAEDIQQPHEYILCHLVGAPK